MRYRYGLLILIALTCCSKSRTDENQSTTNGREDSVNSTILTSTQSDALSYIGHIQKFEDNNSFYTDLYFVESFNYDLYNEITKMGDQVIFEDEETKRTRMGTEKIKQYFNLSGLKTINIYNDDNQKLTTGELSHIEYVEDLIESRFVAVFKVNNPSISGYHFCIGNSNDNLSEIDFLHTKTKN